MGRAILDQDGRARGSLCRFSPDLYPGCRQCRPAGSGSRDADRQPAAWGDLRQRPRCGLDLCRGERRRDLHAGNPGRRRAATVTLGVLAPGITGAITNTAGVSAAVYDPYVADNDARAVVEVLPVAGLSLSKSGPLGLVAVQAPVTYTLAVGNDGPQAAEAVTVTDYLPLGVTFVATQGADWTCDELDLVVTCHRATLAVGDVSTIALGVLAPATAGPITNTAAVDAATHDTDPTNNEAQAVVQVVEMAGLSLVKEGPGVPVLVQASFAYTLTVSNAGPQAAENVTVTDVLPAGVTFVAAQGAGWTCAESGGVVSCTRATLAVDDVSMIIVDVVAPAVPGEIANTAAVGAITHDPDLEDNDAEAVVDVLPIADLSLGKSGPAGPVSVGAPVTYTLTVVNDGPQAAGAVTVTDYLSPGVTLVAAGGAGWTCDGLSGTVICTRATLATGAVSTITLNILAPDASRTLTNTATVHAVTHDPNLSNNDAVVVVQVRWFVFLPLVLHRAD